jgi:hypothetical protein
LLDLTLFGIFKREGKSHLPFGDVGTTVDFVYDGYTNMAKTLILPNIAASFQAIAVTFGTESTPYVLCCLFPGKVERVEGIR